jgi:hypothetical protein
MNITSLDYLFNTNLPHIYNSCGINALFIALSYLDIDSNNELIKNMLDYCKKQRKINDQIDTKYGIELMRQFYETYNIDHGYQNCRLLLKKIISTLITSETQLEIGDDYEKIKLLKDMILLDQEQIKSMVEYNKTQEIKTDKIILLRDNEFNNMSIIKFNEDIYIPCLYIVCLNGHYVTMVNIKIGLVIYDDLSDVRLINKEKSYDVILQLGNSVEFIGYVKFTPKKE